MGLQHEQDKSSCPEVSRGSMILYSYNPAFRVRLKSSEFEVCLGCIVRLSLKKEAAY
jgi:hypothetical protein